LKIRLKYRIDRSRSGSGKRRYPRGIYFVKDSWISAEEIGDAFILDIVFIELHETAELSFTISLHFVMHGRHS